MNNLLSSRLRFLASGIAVGTLAISLPAGAFNLTLLDKPLRLDITESFQAAYHLDPGNGQAADAYYLEFISRLNVQASWNHFTLGLRLDSDLYALTPQIGQQLVDAQCPAGLHPPMGCIVTAVSTEGALSQRYQTHLYDPVKGLEKMFLGYSNPWVDITIGDSYVSLGRGLVLAIRKLDQLGIDTTVLGAKAVVHVKGFSGTLVAGWTNIQNLDQTNALYTPDPFDFVAGGRLDYRILDKVSVGVEGAGGLQGDKSSPDQHMRVGVVVDAPRPLPWLSLYGEYMRQYDTIVKTPMDGQAFYGAATILAGITSWSLEVKDYVNYGLWYASNDPTAATVYMEPPTLERIQIQLNSETGKELNILAGRLRGDIRVKPWLTLFVSPEVGSSPNKDLLYDAYAGAELRWNEGKSHAFPLVEYRHEADQTGLLETLTAVEFDVTQALPNPWSLELQGLLWLRDKPTESTGPWQEGDVYIGLKYSPILEATAGWEFTTQSIYIKEQHTFFNGSLQWNFLPGDNINLFVGGQRPGLRCISGVCRNFPAFEGVRLMITVRG